MSRVLIFLTASYPFGGEPFISAEMPYLESALDEVVIVSNDTDGDLQEAVAESTTCLRVPYELTPTERLRSAFGVIKTEPRKELRRVRSAYGLGRSSLVRNTVLVSWAKANKFAGILRRLAAERPGAEVYAYSYWANDMALAAAVAKARGWIDRAVCRAHGWDVYFERSAAGFLPFRQYLAEHLDHYRFVSGNGLAYFRSREGSDYPALGRSPLGTRPLNSEPVSGRDPFVVVSCSAIIPLKRVERIAEALGHVRRDLTWIHIGDGSSRQAVERVVARLPASVRVELTGALPNSEVIGRYRRTRPSLFLNLSETEGLPVTIMEAMSAGIPVIATNVGGVAEIVEDRKNGLLLEADPTVSDVSRAIEAFVDMPDGEYRSYAQAAWSTWNLDYNAVVNYPRFVAEVFGGADANDG